MRLGLGALPLDNLNPIAYYIRCKAGHIKHVPILEGGLQCSPIIWENSFLGVCKKSIVLDRIKESINELIEDLAMDFFKARGEL